MPGRAHVMAGEALRWYLTRARHPLKDYLVGHYWRVFARCGAWVRYDGDGVLHVRLGDYVQQRIFLDGLYERSLVEWMRGALGRHDVFWDVGANVGAVSVVAARLGARVVAFEPDPRSRRWLERNLRANHLTKVTVVPDALGDRERTASLYQSDRTNTGRSSLDPSRAGRGGTVPTRVLRADTFAARHPDLAPTVMKIDVEGAEHLVLRGAVEVLRDGRLHTVIYEDRIEGGGAPANLDAARHLEAAGFAIEPFARSDAHADDGQMNFIARRVEEPR